MSQSFLNSAPHRLICRLVRSRGETATKRRSSRLMVKPCGRVARCSSTHLSTAYIYNTRTDSRSTEKSNARLELLTSPDVIICVCFPNMETNFWHPRAPSRSCAVNTSPCTCGDKKAWFGSARSVKQRAVQWENYYAYEYERTCAVTFLLIDSTGSLVGVIVPPHTARSP